MNYWAVGSSFGGTDDKTKEFIKNNNWFDGKFENGDFVNEKHLKRVRAGDVLVIKSSATKGKGHKITFTKLKAIGIIAQTLDNYHFKVNWFKNDKMPIDFDGISYRKIIEPIREDEIANYIRQYLRLNDLNDNIKLLKHKKQIILQGPPGTGKTRLAKEIADKLVENNYIQLERALVIGTKIPNASGIKDYYTIKILKENTVVLTSKRAKHDWEPTYENILEKLHQLYLKETPLNVNGLHPYELAVAKYLYSIGHILNKNYQLIQFHPSYTYEDFVRGISIKSDGNNLEYVTENKVLGKIAKEAQQNYLDSKKDSSEITKEKWIEEQFELFKDEIIEVLNNGKKYMLTPSVDISKVGDDYFKYESKSWGGWIKYSNFISLYLDGFFKTSQIKSKFKIGARASYYSNLLNLFKDFIGDKIQPTNTNVNKVVLKNYVLIIDEINRANLSSVLGELIYALEYRGEPVESMYKIKDEGNEIILPPNLFIIGTMNTADRSVGQIDYAIRRRFAFVDVLPEPLDESTLENGLKFNTESFKKVANLFIGDNHHLTEEFKAKDVQLGHSYFIHKESDFNMNLEYEIKPILREYVADGILKETALSEIEKL